MCSLAARGLWADMLAIMHESEPYGHLTINGKPPKLEELARVIGSSKREVEDAFLELAKHQVFSTNNGVVFSRRMVRDHEKSQKGAEAAAKGWANRKPNGSPNGSPNGDEHGSPNTYILESRVDIESKEDSISTPAQESGKPKRGRKPSPKQHLPQGWMLDPVDIEHARKHGWDDNKIATEEQRFADYAKANNWLKADWHATWRNWVTSPFQQQRAKNGVHKAPAEKFGPRQGMSPDVGNDYRSPPRTRPQNELKPLPEK